MKWKINCSRNIAKPGLSQFILNRTEIQEGNGSHVIFYIQLQSFPKSIETILCIKILGRGPLTARGTLQRWSTIETVQIIDQRCNTVLPCG